ncbi:DUF1499 domain-containing protein [Thalassovita sp.]|uniref:DUF1499 domain-containing protein n=1 Tax=Thalassovita sp. TaxID=1979401 RepID=UPI002881E8AA|nr:DUF1499 domain-containing protein [Thalassovita sp.]MDF1803887.1 DUF1499 domain-containing protein [Thalassovita sp.]
MKWLVVSVVALVGLGVWVRLAPSDPARWHMPIKGDKDKDFKAGALRVIAGDAARFEALDGIIRGTERTQVLAGSVAEGRVSYVTRSKLWGFPDYTTVELRGDQMAIYGRLRFGRSDLGVNKARISGWLKALAQG